MRQSLELVLHVVPRCIPHRQFKMVGHALCRFDQKTRAMVGLKRGGAQRGEPRRLKSTALERYQGNLEQQPIGVI